MSEPPFPSGVQISETSIQPLTQINNPCTCQTNILTLYNTMNYESNHLFHQTGNDICVVCPSVPSFLSWMHFSVAESTGKLIVKALLFRKA